jgi:hypothetical protein
MILRPGFATALVAIILLASSQVLTTTQVEGAVQSEAVTSSPKRKTPIFAQSDRPASHPPTAGAPLPVIARDAPYGAARQDLLADGWQPLISPDADKCWDGDMRCQGRPEMQACAGTGQGNCLFLWKKGDAVLAVYTIDDPPIISGVECRSGCR